MAEHTETISDALLKREFTLQRFATTLLKNNVDPTIQSLSRKIPSLINEFGEPEDMTLKERREVAKEVAAAMLLLWASMWSEITEELEKMAVMDADHVAGIYDKLLAVVFAIPAASVLIGHINQATMVLTSGTKSIAGIWSKFVTDNIDSAIQTIDGVIWSGYTSGQSNDEIIKRIRGVFNRSTKKYQGGVLQGLTRNQAESLLRTGVSHYSNQARDRMYAANKNIIKSRVLIATLDSRTTLICLGRNLKEWLITDDTFPRLPFHFGERSIYVIKIKGMGESLFFDGEEVKAGETTSSFLKRQNKSFVEETLGKTRAGLFLSGKLKIERFTSATGRTILLKDLK